MVEQEIVRQYSALHERFSQVEFPRNFAALVKSAAARYGDADACVFVEHGKRLGYADLCASVFRFASSLAAIGIGRQSRVAVMLPNIPEFPISWLALGVLGAVMVPVNINYTPDELRYVLTDSQADAIILPADLLSTLEALTDPPGLLATIVVGASDAPQGIGFRSWQVLNDEGDLDFAPDWEVDIEDTINIQYTSGTTGFPKGCVLSQRYWYQIASVLSLQFQPIPRRILVPYSFYYMDPQWMLIWALSVGGTAYVCARPSVSKFLGWLRDYDIEYCIFPEAVTAKEPTADDRDNRLIGANIFGWQPDTHVAGEHRFGVVAREAYGMTEIGVALYMPQEARDMVGSGSCGIPAPERECGIFDDDGRQLGPEEIGELWVRGPSILKEYYRKPEANAENFQDGWFKTGDLFRQDRDGWYYIVGRKKDMIRRSGENISAREIEAVLKKLDAVEDAAAVPVPHPIRKEEVKIYVQLKPAYGPEIVTPQMIVAHCQQHLAAFKVPRYVEYVDRFPRTPSMKIAKHVLRSAKDDLRTGSYDRVDECWR